MANAFAANYGYRKYRGFTSNDAVLTNYQHLIVGKKTGTDGDAEVDLNEHHETDFDDFRVARFVSGTNTFVDEWKEKFTSDTSADKWFEIPEVYSSVATGNVASGQKDAALNDASGLAADDWCVIKDAGDLVGELFQIDSIATNTITSKTNFTKAYTTADSCTVALAYYIYYGYSSESDNSSGANTFIDFDGQEAAGDINDWSQAQGSSTLTRNSDQAYTGTYSLKHDLTGTVVATWEKTFAFPSSGKYAIRVMARPASAGTAGYTYILEAHAADDTRLFIFYFRYGILTYYSGTLRSLIDPVSVKWYVCDLIIDGDNHAMLDIKIDGVSKSITDSWESATDAGKWLVGGDRHADYDGWTDNMLIRKYATGEIAGVAFGAEETASVDATVVSVLMTADAAMLVPALVRDSVFTSSLLTMDGAVLEAVIGLGVEIDAALMAGTAEMLEPALSTTKNPTIASSLLTADLALLTPTLVRDCNIILAEWGNYIDFEIDNTEVTELLTDHPVPLILSTSAGISNEDLTALFSELGANRLKLAIKTADGDECYVESSDWEYNENKGVLFYKAPAIQSDVNTAFRLYFDVLHADNTDHVGATNSSSAEQVWDANFKFVSHMSDGADNAHIYDSTSNDNDGTKKGANEPIEVDGLVGKAQDFDGVDESIILGTARIIPTGTAPNSVEIFASFGTNIPNTGEHKGIIGLRQDTQYTSIIYNEGGTKKIRFGFRGTNLTSQYAATLDGAGYTYLGMRYNGGAKGTLANYDLFIDGALYTTGKEIASSGSSSILNELGGDTGSPYIAADIGEVRISDIGRTAGHIATTNAGLTDALVTYGAPVHLDPPWTMDGAIPIHSLSLGSTTVASLLTMDGTILTPTMRLDKIFAAALLSGDLAALVPTLTLDRIFTATLLTGSLEVPAPAIATGVIITATLLTSNLVMLIPSIDIEGLRFYGHAYTVRFIDGVGYTTRFIDGVGYTVRHIEGVAYTGG